MDRKDKDFQQELHLAFLETLHEEKVETQKARANYISAKFAFITGLFALGALQIGGGQFSLAVVFDPAGGDGL